MKINIAGGTGVMGKVHKPVFEAAGHEVIISGRRTNPTLEEATQEADLTIISVPISTTIPTIKSLAPHCSAIMDFTGVKVSPIDAMLCYSPKNCQVAGLHPLYGDVDSIKGRNIVCCNTERSGEKTYQVIKALQNAGANIIIINPEYHDQVMALLQNARAAIFQAYASTLANSQIPIQDLYNLAPPPTKILLDLIARQVDSKNDKLYSDMREYNPSQTKVNQALSKEMNCVLNDHSFPNIIRAFFGDELMPAQKRAKKLIEKMKE